MLNFLDDVFPWIMGGLCAVVFAVMGLVIWNGVTSVCVRTETIQRVNGCNWQGTCGWVTENFQGYGHAPVEGAKVCVERKEPFPWLR